MNKIHRIVWNASKSDWVVASEFTNGRRKASTRLRCAIAAALVLGGAMSAPVLASEACTTDEGTAGVKDANGVCVIEASAAQGLFMGVLGGTDGGSAPGGNAVALGPGATASGTDSTTLGFATVATATATNAVVVGNEITVEAADAIAIGTSNRNVVIDAASTGATTIGSLASVSNSPSSIAFGRGSTVTNATNGIAMGAGSRVSQLNGIALGPSASVTGSGGIALGTGASALAGNGVAIGLNSVADRVETVSVGSSVIQRQIVNVRAGTLDNDAVNVAQLKPGIAALGGGASFNANGTVTGPTYTVQGGTQTTVGGALDALDTAVTTNTTNIANNTSAITNLDGRVTNNETSITNIRNEMDSGTIGLVQRDAVTGNITVAGSLGGGVVDMNGTAGPRVVTGVANGRNDTDAVSIAQLKAVGVYDPVADRILGALVYDDVGLGMATLGGVNGTVIANLANGSVAKGSMEAVNGGQLFDMREQLQSQLDNLDGRVGTIETGIADGSIGGGGGGGPVNDGGGKPIHNVGDGVAPSDAATVGQVGAQVNEAIKTANNYTDAKFGALTQTLNDFKGEVDRRFQQQDVKISRVGAMSAAMSQMAFSAQGVNTPNRIGVGVGTQGGKSALAVGYSRSVAPNVNLSFGGSASGSETSAGAGLGIGW